jgi:hypothetical protein
MKRYLFIVILFLITSVALSMEMGMDMEIRKKINWKSFWTYWYILIFFSVIAWAANQDFDLDTDTKIDDAFLDLATDINGIVECDGAADCSAASDILSKDTTPQLGGDLDLNGNAFDFPTTANIDDVLDEDNMSSNSAVKLATQQSIKAYVDANASGDIISEGDSNAEIVDAGSGVFHGDIDGENQFQMTDGVFSWINAMKIRLLTTTDAHERCDDAYDVDGATWASVDCIKNDNEPQRELQSGAKWTGLGPSNIPINQYNADQLNDTSTAHLLTAAEVSGTFLNNYDSSAEAKQYDLPAAAEGYNFIFCMGVAQNVVIHPNGTDIIYLNGTALDGGDKVSNTSPTIGECVSFASIQTGASTWGWIARSADADWVDGGA